MHIVLFYHSLLSDWNHGNAHFLRGVVTELQQRGHRVSVYEPRDNWSLDNLRQGHGDAPLEAFRRQYPQLQSRFYDPARLDLDEALGDADLVIVHEWNDHDLVARIGRYRLAHPRFRLLFHDTHHRSVSEPESMRSYDLRYYDGVLAFGEVIRQLYLERGWTGAAWTWHEAADTRVFRPLPEQPLEGDLVWIGNWGDEERSQELREFLLEPVRDLKLKARVHGVRYPDHARKALAEAGIDYRGWLANFEAPRAFAAHKVTVHVPRRYYRTHLPGIPTIRVFEALACGIPLVSAPWEDSEELFRPGQDYLIAADGAQMRGHLRALTQDSDLRAELAASGRQRILERHTCAHRVDELLAIHAELNQQAREKRA